MSSHAGQAHRSSDESGARLSNLPEEVRALEDRHRAVKALRALQEHAETMEQRTAAQTIALDRIVAELDPDRRAAAVGPIVLKVSSQRCKAHAVARGSCSGTCGAALTVT